MKKIDAHIHLNQAIYFDEIAKKANHENTTMHLEDTFKRLDITHGIVMGNHDLDLKSHCYPKFLSYCIGLDSHYLAEHSLKDSINLVEEHLKQQQCVGIKLYPGYSHYYVSDKLYYPYYELAKKYNKVVAIHTGSTAGNMGLLKYSHPLTVDEVAIQFPTIQFVMCHMGNPWVMDAAAVMDKNENVAADLSGMLEGCVDINRMKKDNGGYLDYLRTWIGYLHGYDRLMYGTDWPLVHIDDYIEFTEEIIPEKYLEKVFYDNAKRIYNLNTEQ